MRILLVEDDNPIAEAIKGSLERVHFRVDVATNGNAGLERLRETDYALLILDIMLPGMDGLTLCRTLRDAHDPVLILMLTARDSLNDRVNGLEMGADDYLAKPFQFSELLARVRALLRRDKIHRARILRVADLEIDTGTRRVVRGGREIVLTPREYDLLAALAAQAGHILHRDTIQQRIWMEESLPNAVDVCVAQLRKKVDASFEAKLIQTVYGLGYRLQTPEAVQGIESGGGRKP